MHLSHVWLAAGSSRTVSRRYIADFVSKKNRMRASTGMHPQWLLQATETRALA
jgi:hypothetical protein